jgi:hypothetical protein
MTNAEREELAIDIEEALGDLLRSKQVLMNGAMCRRVEMVAQLVADVAQMKQPKDDTIWDEVVSRDCADA